MNRFLLFFGLVVLAGAVNAQKSPGIVKGILQDSTGQALDDATVSIMTAKDSTLVSFSLTSNSGFFEIKNVEAGNYILIVSYTGFETLKKPFSISAEKPVADLRVIKMEKAYQLLGEVIVKDDAPIKINGDTVAYNADAFKTKPNATVEDLLKKLPGVSVEKDGTVKAQGENVGKVYVDGKEFFSNDPKLATKNLTADMVDQVEVFDDMSEQAKFNKIDDGSRTKAINLKLKKDKKKGLFGKAYAGYGTEERYDGGITANMFKGATQVSVIAKANNTNNMGFTLTDMMGMFGSGGFGGMSSAMGGGGGMTMGGRGMPMGGNFSMGGSSSGITRTGSAGLNYRDTWSKHFDVNGSYFYNNAENNNIKTSLREYTLPRLTDFQSQKSWSTNMNGNHRFNFNLNYMIDSFNSIIYQPGISFQNSEMYREDTSRQFKQNGDLVNRIRNLNEVTGNGMNMSNNLMWRHKMRKPGRTFSLSLTSSRNGSDRETYSSFEGEYYNLGVKTERDTKRFIDQENNSMNLGATASYTEPLSRNKILELNYGYNRNFSESDRNTYDFNTATGKYDNANITLSNHFENYNISNRIGSNYRFIEKKYNYQLGLSVQNTLLKSNNLSKSSEVSQRFTNIFPTASFQYQFARSKSLRVNYRGRSNQPSISQLQDVMEESGAPYYRVGNPALNQEFSNNLSVSYNFFDMVKFRNVFALINFSNTSNKIVDRIWTDTALFPRQYRTPEYAKQGNQISSYANLSGVYNITGAFNIGFPIRKMKGGNFNTNSRITYAKNGNIINDTVNYSTNFTVGEDLRLSYNYKDKLDMGVSTSHNYTKVNSGSANTTNSTYFTQVYSADVTYTFPKNFILSNDFDYTINARQNDPNVDRDFVTWNASFAKQFGKNKRTELKLSAFDILGQNQSYSRYAYEGNYIEDIRNTVLERFFLLTLTYNLNRMGGKSMLPPAIQRATKNIRIH